MGLAVVMRRDLVAELLRGPMALAAAGTVTNGFNLVMNLVLARALDPAGYGAVGVQTSIFMILSVVGNSVLTATVHRESAEIGDTRRERRIWIRQLRNVTLVGVVLASVLALALCEPVSLLLSYPHPLAVAEAAIAAAIWVGLCVERGLLQARGNYPALARNLVFESAFRITCVVVLVAAGLGVNGAGIGLALGCLAGGEHARLAVARTPSLIRRSPSARSRLRGGDDVVTPTPTVTGPIPMMPAAATPRRTRDSLIAEASVALATLVPLALLQNMDIVIVGWRNPDGVGSYAAISTACKVPVFIGLAVANFLLPEAARRRKEGLPAGRALTMALVCVVTPGLFLAAVGAVAGHLILSLVFGPKLAGAAPDLWVLALAMTYLAASLMFATYLLGAGYRKIVWALACCTPLTAAVLTLAGGDIGRTAAAGLACQAFTAAVAGALVYRMHHHHFAAAGDRARDEDVRLADADLAVAAAPPDPARSAGLAEPAGARPGSGAYEKTVARRRPAAGSRVVFAELAPPRSSSGRRSGPAAPTADAAGPASG
ncbi:lipopolysaccharide biosynthesis protein [Frankia sp. AgB1.9]|uniref:lipopolysaccharide biosynthesis protein n=1 Tax=unclassified Frankia TaxID=2632575 RepID=UPI00193440C5|nr:MULTISPECIES: lipopolysaccharide biosynthesis protein [unclassified Frankia]MBL7489519.1 lipopolysaccharide biosynthesis protein [Frankia sp. AgW1.1]MBL7547902.1 lipopolysaccharide biosynthesis protein [Frankia sp. AgB1.9]MBL7621374.1 lipopolysaccharide biosynthesis protein [Frankia sp. AgB1.8]